MKSIQEIVIQFVEDIPEAYIGHVADLLNHETKLDGERLTHQLQSLIPQEAVQESIRQFVGNWVNSHDAPTTREMALLITSVAAALKYQQGKQAIELTWTGPQTRPLNFRRTDQALIELINSANQRVIIVSFAVYKAQSIMSALERAAKRGVEIDIIVESSDASEGKIAYDTIAALGRTLKSMARIFIWPLTKREIDPNGNHGTLHAKVAIGDLAQLYISSANLTDYAMNLNMEMGVLISGGDLPVKAQRHFDELIMDGVLNELSFE
jgi:phosphatidylserine/phosphatidylglycerophosphate/cardiolipin synthase-like enzyme